MAYDVLGSTGDQSGGAFQAMTFQENSKGIQQHVLPSLLTVNHCKIHKYVLSFIFHPQTHLMLLSKASNILSLFMLAYWRRQWHPTPVLLPGKSHG